MNNNYKKIIDWLYSKEDCSDYQKLLRSYMLLGWAKQELEALKFDLSSTFDTQTEFGIQNKADLDLKVEPIIL